MKSTPLAEPTQSGAFRLEALISGVLIVLGLTVISGWLLHVPRMVELKSGMVPMVFNTAFCFLFAGTALSLLQRPGPTARRLYTILGSCLILFGAATLLELLLDKSLGIDLAFLQTWYDYGNIRPGRMAPNTALGFVLIGATILLTNRVTNKKRAVAVVALTFSVLAIGLTGLVGYSLGPDLLFGWARSARMAAHTATGMILYAIGLWLMWSKSEWYASSKYFREDEKIWFLGTSILLVVTITTGLSGFVLQQNALQKILEDGLESELQNRTALLLSAVDQGSRQAVAAARLVRFDDASQAVLLAPGSQAADARFTAFGNRLIAEQFLGLALQDSAGKNVRILGNLNPAPEIVAPVNASGSAQLIWDKKLILRTWLPLMQHDQKIGAIVMDQSASSLNKALFNVERLGETGEIAACIPRTDDLLCFPGSQHTSPFVVPKRSKTGLPLPMEIALTGKQGHLHTLDYRSQNVVAAFGPIAPGFALVVKEDTKALYAVIREALQFGAPFMLVIGLMGAALLYSQLKPLSARMLASETAANEKELEIRTVVEAVGDGILAIDELGSIRSVNPAICTIFGYEADELVGNNITMLMPAESRAAHRHGMDQFIQGRPARLVGKPSVEVNGLNKNGEEFTLELKINQVPLSGRRLFVGVMRDITERKEMQRKLMTLAQYDSLTGLPNRSLFMDRLTTAALRTERSGAAIALMFLDLDGFKKVNDSLGHQSGDELLVQFSRRLSALVRKTDTVGRLSGDEFTVLLEGLARPKKDARFVADKIIDAMQVPFFIYGDEINVTVSLGLVLHESRPGAVNVADLLRRADQQMYLAKRAGKNCVSMA